MSHQSFLVKSEAEEQPSVHHLYYFRMKTREKYFKNESGFELAPKKLRLKIVVDRRARFGGWVE